MIFFLLSFFSKAISNYSFLFFSLLSLHLLVNAFLLSSFITIFKICSGLFFCNTFFFSVFSKVDFLTNHSYLLSIFFLSPYSLFYSLSKLSIYMGTNSLSSPYFFFSNTCFALVFSVSFNFFLPFLFLSLLHHFFSNSFHLFSVILFILLIFFNSYSSRHHLRRESSHCHFSSSPTLISTLTFETLSPGHHSILTLSPSFKNIITFVIFTTDDVITTTTTPLPLQPAPSPLLSQTLPPQRTQ